LHVDESIALVTLPGLRNPEETMSLVGF
jgi:hypothetical protein